MLNEDKRKNRRYPSIARAVLPKFFSGDALLKDLSVTGCCIECTMQVDVEIGGCYGLQVIPEEASEIGPFELAVECRWFRPAGYSCDIGFGVTKSPNGKAFGRYVDYLAWRSNQNP
ncbi:MAG: PilZ domain-containing protein [Treponema sp.]|jgi:hypothetical protein|nr:PilZ domain-containing protein [Treponema sp.]